jgi:glycosyltransferase involved in cell wall biosynthesis
VSVIVPTHNSAQTLSLCLQSVKNQTYKSFEVIVVDDFSIDETVRIAGNFGVKVLQRRCNPALARNVGVTISSGKYILFLDSDQVLSPPIIEECVRKCEDENAGMIRIPEVFVGKGFWGSCSALWKNYYSKGHRIYEISEDMMDGEPRFFVKEYLIQAGMLNDAMLWGEDYDLHKRMKRMNVKEDSCMSNLYHYEPSLLREILFKLFRYGKSMPTFVRDTRTQVFKYMLTNSLLTLKDIYRQNGRFPTVVVGCTFLLWLKTCFLVTGLLTGYELRRGVNG